jgi:hypothetical protein
MREKESTDERADAVSFGLLRLALRRVPHRRRVAGSVTARTIGHAVTTIPSICMCSCHYWNKASNAAMTHPGMACWCQQAQAPIVVEPPKFCPHCGKKL